MSDPLSLALSGLSGLKTAIDLTKTLSDVRDAAKLAAVRVELLSLLVEAQESQLSLIGEKRELAERISQLEAWDGEKERYQLTDVGNGCLAYSLKPDAQPPEPPHSICANCYQQGRKSILVPFTLDVGRAEALQCHACDSEMIVRGIDMREARRLAARRPAAKPGSLRF